MYLTFSSVLAMKLCISNDVFPIVTCQLLATVIHIEGCLFFRIPIIFVDVSVVILTSSEIDFKDITCKESPQNVSDSIEKGWVFLFS